jgi:hypothetical protein
MSGFEFPMPCVPYPRFFIVRCRRARQGPRHPATWAWAGGARSKDGGWLHGCVQLYGGKRRKGPHITTHQLAQSEASLFLEAQYCPEGYMYNQATNQVQSYAIR